MKKEGNKLRTQHRPISRLRMVLNCCLIVFYALFVVSEPGGLKNSGSEGLLPTSLRLHANFITAEHHSSQNPLRERPTAVVSEVIDSDKSESDCDDDVAGLSHSLPLEISSNLHSGKSLLLELKHANESLARISLFVLHHSWKSYLL